MVMTQPAPDDAAIKATQQQMWATGDDAVPITAMLSMAETLCEALDLRVGHRVLDVAGGSGNAALAAARRFCEVTCTDDVPALRARGRERAAAERLPITFAVADAEDVLYPDAAFDAVMSTVGVMFAPHQERTVAELLRVCRPDGSPNVAQRQGGDGPQLRGSLT